MEKKKPSQPTLKIDLQKVISSCLSMCQSIIGFPKLLVYKEDSGKSIKWDEQMRVEAFV